MDNFIKSAKLLSNKNADEVSTFIKQNMAYAVDNGEYAVSSNTLNKELVLHKLIGVVPGAALVDDILFKTVSKAIVKFLKPLAQPHINSDISDTEYLLREVTGPTREHVDGTTIKRESEIHRIGTIIISLSDSKDKLVFPKQKVEILLTKGIVIFFPPFWTHPHSTKYAGKKCYRVQTWLGQKPSLSTPPSSQVSLASTLT